MFLYNMFKMNSFQGDSQGLFFVDLELAVGKFIDLGFACKWLSRPNLALKVLVELQALSRCSKVVASSV